MKQKARDPAHWREMAEEARKVAEHLDEASKRLMLEVAQGYDRLATLVENGAWPSSDKEGKS